MNNVVRLGVVFFVVTDEGRAVSDLSVDGSASVASKMVGGTICVDVVLRGLPSYNLTRLAGSTDACLNLGLLLMLAESFCGLFRIVRLTRVRASNRTLDCIVAWFRARLCHQPEFFCILLLCLIRMLVKLA
jgi:hypothetical protein